MARVYVRSFTRSTMYQKALHFLAGTGVWKISSVACGFSSIRIDYSDYPKSLISIINEVYAFSIKCRYSDILLKEHTLHILKPFVLLQSHLLFCEHGFCDVSVTLYNVSVTLSSALSKYILVYIRGLNPRNFAELAEIVPIERLARLLSAPYLLNDWKDFH